MKEWEEVTKEDFAEFLKNMRTAAGMSWDEFGERVGYKGLTIRRYEDPSKKSVPKDIYAFMVLTRTICLPLIRARRNADGS